MAKYKQLGTAKRNCGKKIVEKKTEVCTYG